LRWKWVQNLISAPFPASQDFGLNILLFFSELKGFEQMKRHLSIGLGILAVAVAIPFASGTPVLANLQEAGTSIVKNILQPKMKLVLGAEKKVQSVDAQGKTVVAFKALEGNVSVQPGDVLRYTLSSQNAGDKPASKLVLTQPVPAHTQYVIGSALANGAKLTYSIDSGKSFVAKPTIKVKQADGAVVEKPAPAAMYSHVRWDYSASVKPASAVRSVYEVAVK
jgi:uncharacterized repeat protein (TIGR01451 family)